MKNAIKYIGSIIGSLILILIIYDILTKEEILSINQPIGKIIVEKSKRRMYIYSNGKIIRTYVISLGFNSLGSKRFEGDGKTPEGIYTINDKNPKSAFHLNLGISYPNEEDKKYALKLNKNPGGNIKIHGIKNGFGFIGKFHRFFDWTAGCIAVTNKEIEELYKHIPIGTEIEIKM